jgi:hypothetical protein
VEVITEAIIHCKGGMHGETRIIVHPFAVVSLFQRKVAQLNCVTSHSWVRDRGIAVVPLMPHQRSKEDRYE